MYLLNYPILMYVMIQEKSPANETELQFIVDIKLAAFISSVNHETDTRLHKTRATQSTFFRDFSCVQTYQLVQKGACDLTFLLRGSRMWSKELYLE